MNTTDKICRHFDTVAQMDAIAVGNILREHDAERQAEIDRLRVQLAAEKAHNPMNSGNLDVDEYYREECDHPWHTNGGLIYECPQCHEAAAAAGGEHDL